MLNPTIIIYKKVIEEIDQIGLVLQSNLKRSYSDLRKLLSYSPKYKVSKGSLS